MTAFMGIDPGASGALALYDAEANRIMKLYDMPTHTITVSGKKRKRIDQHALDRFMEEFEAYWPRLLAIEDVHSMPLQGVTSAFSFGKAAGCVEQAAVCHKLPISLVDPAAWKRAMGLTKDKDSCRRAASRLIPSAAHHWPLKGHDGRAEAAILAVYASRIYTTTFS